VSTKTCLNCGKQIELKPIHEDCHGKHIVCKNCGGSQNMDGEPFTNTEEV
jgi:transcription elongation factor Elf1